MAGDIWLTPLALTNWGEWSLGSGAVMTAIHKIGHAVYNLTDVSTSAGLVGAVLPAELNFRSWTTLSYSVVPGTTAGDTPIGGGLSEAPSTPMILDILAAQYIYGANMSHNSGDDTYVFLPGQQYYETIWDAGGTDTLDFSLLLSDLDISLVPGTLSDVGTIITTTPSSGATQLTYTLGLAFAWVGLGPISDGWSLAGTGDFNGDGTDDILWVNTSAEAVGMFAMDDGVPTWAGIGPISAGWSFAGTGDFNGDGTDDILWHNASLGAAGMFEMADGVAAWVGIGAVNPGWDIAGTGDYNGDGTDDILLHNAGIGAVGMFEMADGTPTWAAIASIDPGWEIV